MNPDRVKKQVAATINTKTKQLAGGVISPKKQSKIAALTNRINK